MESAKPAPRGGPRRLRRLAPPLVSLLLLSAAGAVLLASLPPGASAGTPPSSFQDTLVAAGLGGPLSLAFLPDGTGRAIVVEQGGRIVGWDGASFSTLHTMTEVVTGSERGLLGVAVDPDWPSRPYAYVHYTTNPGTPYVQVARFNLTQPGGALSLDPSSKFVLLGDMPDNAFNHNGGTLRFAPDKTLYVSVGDDAVACNAQDLAVLAGKLLRIRVDDGIDPANRATLAPPDNPFASDPNDNTKLVWAYGLRNPFRFDIHPDGRVFIGDVGQNAFEEVSVANASGVNFGWPYFEAYAPFRVTPCPTDPSIPANLEFPIYAYPHGVGGKSVIGAAVYRGADYPNDASFPPAYEGDFFFMEYYDGWLRVLREGVGGAFDLVPGVGPTDWGASYAFVADMVPGPDGGMYFVTGGGQFRRIAYVPVAPPPPTDLDAALVAGLDDVRLTWTPSSPEADVDHYEVHRASAYDPARTGYAKVSLDAAMPPGTSSWTDAGAGAAAGAYFYFVRAVSATGDYAETAGQVGKLSRALAAGPNLVSTSVANASADVGENFLGTASWSVARAFDAGDPADPWKRHDRSQSYNDLSVADRTTGVWIEVAIPGDVRVAGRVPCSTPVGLRAGWNLVGFPSMTSRPVSAATAGLSGPLRVEGYDGVGPYRLRALDPASPMNPMEAYWIHSPTDQTWTVVNDGAPGCA